MGPKIFAIIVLSLVFFASAYTIVAFYDRYFPIVNAGECVAMDLKDGKSVGAKVLENYSEESSSLVKIYFDKNKTAEYVLPYSAMRYFNAKEISCENLF
jgi:hypothetical protein